MKFSLDSSLNTELKSKLHLSTRNLINCLQQRKERKTKAKYIMIEKKKKTEKDKSIYMYIQFFNYIFEMIFDGWMQINIDIGHNAKLSTNTYFLDLTLMESFQRWIQNCLSILCIIHEFVETRFHDLVEVSSILHNRFQNDFTEVKR